MKFELKQLSPPAIPRALQRAERYRLLNQPDQAESICRDILRIEPDHQKALVNLILALTDQFESGWAERFNRSLELVSKLKDEYHVTYYTGIIYERRARARLHQGLPNSDSVAYEWFRRAMDEYEKAEKLKPPDDDEALLRWNSCARMIMDHDLKAGSEETFQPFLE
ncbi:MAG TPA: hypothetical protein VKZ59_02770 [Acidobacteriota bacterium]|nr:hypothetical protein [Acidobacteriota bacterium]